MSDATGEVEEVSIVMCRSSETWIRLIWRVGSDLVKERSREMGSLGP